MERQEKALRRWCDMRCPHAEFPKDYGLDGAGSCRTFVALHCRLLERSVPKNTPCSAQAEGLEVN